MAQQVSNHWKLVSGEPLETTAAIVTVARACLHGQGMDAGVGVGSSTREAHGRCPLLSLGACSMLEPLIRTPLL